MPTPNEIRLNFLRAAREYGVELLGYCPTGLILEGPSGHLPHRVPLPDGDLPGDSVALPPRRLEQGRARPWNSGPDLAVLSDGSAAYHPDLGPDSTYFFGPMQAKVVKLLWRAAEEGVGEVSQTELLKGAGSESVKLCDVFRRHPAWGRLVVRGERPGTYRLAPVRDRSDD